MLTTDVMVLRDGSTYTGIAGCKLVRVDAVALDTDEQEAIESGALLVAFGREGQDAFSALAKLVRREYPQGLSLVEIAKTWGVDATGAEARGARHARATRLPG